MQDLDIPSIPFLFVSALIVVIITTKLFSWNKVNSNDHTVLDEANPEKEDKICLGGHISIYYGTQTGTSETLANELKEELETNHGFVIRVLDIEDAGESDEDIQKELLNSLYQDSKKRSRAIFLMATYGEGGPADNSVSFVEMLERKSGIKGPASDSVLEQSDIDSDCLSGLEYSVFGLGNTQYAHYNAMGKLVDKCLSKIGATRVVELGLGNDDENTEEDFKEWKNKVLIPSLTKRYIVN